MTAGNRYDEQLFEQLYERNYQMVYRLCYTYMKNSYDAEDCTEDVFVKVYTGQLHFNDENHEKAYLSVMAINTCKDHLRAFWRKKVIADEDIERHSYTVDRSSSYLLQEIMNLPDKYKDVVYMHYYLGYKTDEVAELLKRKPSTVRNQLAEARKLLKNRLEEIDNE